MAFAGLMALAVIPACTTVDAAISENQQHLVTACKGATAAHVAYVGAAAFYDVPASVSRIHDQAWPVAEAICRNPASVRDVPTALAALADAWAAMVKATEAARSG